MRHVHPADTDDRIAGCFRVMHQLRPHLVADEFVARVREQQTGGYLMAFVDDDGVKAVAGYRFIHNLVLGRTLYVDDLVTDEACRSKGHGTFLLDWIVIEARRHGCRAVTLDSGVQRFDAHRFYLVNRMSIAAHHFSLIL